MKLIIPFVDKLSLLDSRLIKLAEFLGVSYETLDLAGSNSLERTSASTRSCVIVNPEVIAAWLGKSSISLDAATEVLAQFPFALVHGLRTEPFDDNLVAALSRNHMGPLERVGEGNFSYEIAVDAGDVCGPYAGLSFGPVNDANDTVFSSIHASTARALISVAERPFMASVVQHSSTVFFIAGGDIADLDVEVGSRPLVHFFSRLLPHAMVLRHLFGAEAWQPRDSYASLVIDDPLIRQEYGFLNFPSLLTLMKQYGFCSNVAFIPHNCRRSLRRTVKLFRENQDCMSLCFHGNDHTGAEFASTDTTLLNTMLMIAEQRMKVHRARTGLKCDRIMVFPQGHFSEEAMRVLKAHNFEAAVNTTCHPLNQPSRLLLRELAQPSIRRYGGFPLFVRTSSANINVHDVAFNSFFGRPILIVEHHSAFRLPESVIDAVGIINSVRPKIRWACLSTVITHAALWRRTPDGEDQVRPYARSVEIMHDSDVPRRFELKWTDDARPSSVESVVLNGVDVVQFKATGTQLRVTVEVPPHSPQLFSLVHKNPYPALKSLGLRRNAKAFVRRRLSEIKDNYLSKNAHILKMAEFLKTKIS